MREHREKLEAVNPFHRKERRAGRKKEEERTGVRPSPAMRYNLLAWTVCKAELQGDVSRSQTELQLEKPIALTEKLQRSGGCPHAQHAQKTKSTSTSRWGGGEQPTNPDMCRVVRVVRCCGYLLQQWQGSAHISRNGDDIRTAMCPQCATSVFSPARSFGCRWLCRCRMHSVTSPKL